MEIACQLACQLAKDLHKTEIAEDLLRPLYWNQ